MATYAEDIVAEVVRLRGLGLTYYQIRDETGVPVSTISSWVGKHAQPAAETRLLSLALGIQHDLYSMRPLTEVLPRVQDLCQLITGISSEE